MLKSIELLPRKHQAMEVDSKMWSNPRDINKFSRRL